MNTLEKYLENQEHQEYLKSQAKQRFVPFLFATPMVYAVNNLTKTETRRMVFGKKTKFNKYKNIVFLNTTENNNFLFSGNLHGSSKTETFQVKPLAYANDILWVRETWQITDWEHPTSSNYGYIYKASTNGQDWQENSKNFKWKPSIFMPKAACRTFLKVTSVHIERLQDITAESSVKEGIKKYGNHNFEDYVDKSMFLNDPKESFKTLWQSINGPESWDLNPYVFVYKFQKIEKPINFN